ncbi:MAG: hypothetical protein ACFE0O_14820 [Opitutales bacterium]
MKILLFLLFFFVHLNCEGKGNDLFFQGPSDLPRGASNPRLDDQLFNRIKNFYSVIQGESPSTVIDFFHPILLQRLPRTYPLDGLVIFKRKLKMESQFGPEKLQLRVHDVHHVESNGQQGFMLIMNRVEVSKDKPEGKENLRSWPIIVEDRGVIIDIWLKDPEFGWGWVDYRAFPVSVLAPYIYQDKS